MKALAVTGPHELSVDDVPEPTAGQQALVRVHRGGLCGTDRKILSGAVPVEYPRVLGHELVGTVVGEAPGGRVSEGSRVLIDPSVACGRCSLCRADRHYLCPDGAMLGRDMDGGFAELLAVDDAQLLTLPPQIGDEEGPLLQILGTCVHAQTLVDVFPGQTAAVVGLGVSGLLHVQLLRARGIDRIVGITRSAEKRRLAEELGATITAAPPDAAAAVAALTDGEGAELVIESAGTVATLAQAVSLAGLGGRLLMFGTLSDSGGADKVPWYDFYYKELAILNSRAGRHRDYARAVDLVAAGTVRLEPLVARSFPLAKAEDAFAALDEGLLKVEFDLMGSAS